MEKAPDEVGPESAKARNLRQTRRNVTKKNTTMKVGSPLLELVPNQTADLRKKRPYVQTDWDGSILVRAQSETDTIVLPSPKKKKTK